ncbi:mucin-5AC-like [Penaeus japonicus]|uniref:mucin-5AC-like n=1 Tax=Penaeus japonicus TaxID=27405 RepID=UPI001C7137F8|nr:mucin-5AC-like [Penaeus japonicus]
MPPEGRRSVPVTATEDPAGTASSSTGALDAFQGQPPTPPPERSSRDCGLAVNGIRSEMTLSQSRQTEEAETASSALPAITLVAGEVETERDVQAKKPVALPHDNEVQEVDRSPHTPPSTPPEKPPRAAERDADAALPPNALQESPLDVGSVDESVETTVSPLGEPVDPAKCDAGTEDTALDTSKHSSVNEETITSQSSGVVTNEAPSTVLPVPNLCIEESEKEKPSINSSPLPPVSSASETCKLGDPQLAEASVPSNDTNDLLPSSQSTSSHSIGSYRSLPRPSPARRSSRAGSVSLAQPSSMSNSYDGSDRTAEEKGAPAHSSHASTTVGGSLPSSPSVPRRTRRPHPVPAARSLQTLSSSPAKLSVATERGTLSSDAAYRKVSLPAKLNEPAREAPVPKPRKVSLNPFDSDEDNEDERRRQSAPREAPVPLPRKKVSLNPFESDDDDDDDGGGGGNQETAERSKESRAVEAPKAAGTNPFDEDEEEEETSIWKVNAVTGELEFKPMLSSSPATNSRSSSQSSLTIQRLNDSIASLNAQLAKTPNETESTNPFDEDEDDEFNDTGLSRDSTRMSLSMGSSSPLQRDGARCSLPPTTRTKVGRKKRPAPLPPGQRPPIPSTAPFEHRFDHDSLPRGGSTGSLPQGSPRRAPTGSLHNLSVSPRIQSPRKPPPPRPPPPKRRSSSQTRN